LKRRPLLLYYIPLPAAHGTLTTNTLAVATLAVAALAAATLTHMVSGGMVWFERGALLTIVGPILVLVQAADPQSRLLFAIALFAGLVVGCSTVVKGADGTVSPFRPYVAIVMPLYFASCMLVAALPYPPLCIALAFVATEAKIGFCMSVCLHRYAAHAAFRCGSCTSFALGWLGCMANQGGPLWWASKHRAHHKFCDGPHDPHSAIQDGEVLATVTDAVASPY
jgi:hypothetical protein